MKSLFSLLILAYFFFPRVDIITIGSGSIRVNDFIAIISILTAFQYLLSNQNKSIFFINRAFKIYLIFISVSLISALFSGFSTSLVNVIRLLEYALFYFVGVAMLSAGVDFKRLSIQLLAIGLVFLVLEFSGVSFDHRWTGGNRAVLTFAGPYEVATFFGFLYFFYQKLHHKMGSFIFILTAQSRITLLYFMLVYGYKSFKIFMTHGSIVKKFFISSTFLIVISLILITDNRFSQTFSKLEKTVSISMQESENRTFSGNRNDYFDLFLKREMPLQGIENIDHSLAMRLITWGDVISVVNYSLKNTVIGSGPGYFGAAVDGAFIRILGENGIIGLIVFIIFLSALYKEFNNFQLGHSILLLIVTGLMIDIFYSSKIMPLIFIYLAYTTQYYKKTHKTAVEALYDN